MSDSQALFRRLAPALAVTGAAAGLVMTFDPAVGGTAPGATATTRTTTSAVPDTDSDSTSGSGTDSGTTTGQGSTCSGTPLTGPTVSTRWGPVQVSAVVSANGTVCSSTALAYPTGDLRSQVINARAIPIIEARVAETGDTSFDAVSGATITSEGYRASLQALLDSR